MPRDGNLPRRRRTIVMPWKGRNAALLAAQVRCSTGAVARAGKALPVATLPVQVVPQATVSLVERVFMELVALAAREQMLPTLAELGRRTGGNRVSVGLALEALVRAGRITMQVGEGQHYHGGRAIGMGNGRVLRNAQAPKWWLK